MSRHEQGLYVDATHANLGKPPSLSLLNKSTHLSHLNQKETKFFLIPPQLPVILTDTCLVGSAYHWSLDYLTANLGEGKFTVYSSPSGKFKYYDEKKVPHNKGFIPPTSNDQITFKEFTQKLKTEKNQKKRSFIVNVLIF